MTEDRRSPKPEPFASQGVIVQTRLDLVLECQRLIIHMIKAQDEELRDCGYATMSREQRILYDAIWERSPEILEGKPLLEIAFSQKYIAHRIREE